MLAATSKAENFGMSCQLKFVHAITDFFQKKDKKWKIF
jgi:hypothetical protein